MSKFKISFTLKQHTPLIHFQANQSGATLRATELKPKFDKFLLEKNPNLPKKTNSNGYYSLEYKVKIEPNISQSEVIAGRNPLFFGNMGDGDDKEFKTHNKEFEIEFFSFKSEIIEAIKENFEAFLANTNFGTRQSKGFGSFYITDKSFNKNLIPYKVYSFNSNNWQKDVGLLYQFLRQGINLSKRPRSPFYTKPAIFSYAKLKGWQWDKKTIKQHFFNQALEQQIEEHHLDVVEYSSNTKYLLKDLFGLSNLEKWKSYYVTIEKEGKSKETINGKEVTKIQRFKSPITFKIVENVVYFWVDDSYQTILNETFTIKNQNQSFDLPTPQNFNFNEFLDFAVNINLNSHIQGKFHNTNEYRNLKRILNNIKASL